MTLTIDLGKVRNKVGATLSFDLNTENLDLLQDDLLITKPLQIRARVKNTGNILQLEGKVETEISTQCDRCLDKVILPVTADFSEKLIHKSDLNLLQYLTKDEIEEEYIIFEKELFDIKDIVRESIILALPAKILCAEKCRGICAKCGQNLNKASCSCTSEEIDPRLAILAKLKRN